MLDPNMMDRYIDGYYENEFNQEFEEYDNDDFYFGEYNDNNYIYQDDYSNNSIPNITELNPIRISQTQIPPFVPPSDANLQFGPQMGKSPGFRHPFSPQLGQDLHSLLQLVHRGPVAHKDLEDV